MLKVYNTLTRSKKDFIPLHYPFVGMYVCGPTVYDDPHLGHAKSYVSFDVIVRFLRAKGYKVRYVQNITDVGHLLEEDGEDRVQKKARIEKLEPVEIAQKYENHFFRDMDKLNCLRPDISCRATGHIPEMIELVRKLVEKGYGYEVDGNIYFDISKFTKYGNLSGRTVEDLVEGVRVKVAEGKKHPADFALWKRSDPTHLMQWPSPWGRGYPGWHLECSVMSMKYLGDSIDIHGGGLDNMFPHHECEIAQSEAATGKRFVNYWLHNNMVTVNGQKMSKSLDNFVTLWKLFEKYDPMTVRFFILQGNYRSPQDFSDQALDAAKKGWQKLRTVVFLVRDLLGKNIQKTGEIKGGNWKEFRDKFYGYMEDDFNTAGAVSVLFDIVKTISNIEPTDKTESVSEEEVVLHAWGPNPEDAFKSADCLFRLLGEEILGLHFEEERSIGLEADLINILIELRQKFRDCREWELADEIRTKLESAGIILEDKKDGTKWRKKLIK